MWNLGTLPTIIFLTVTVSIFPELVSGKTRLPKENPSKGPPTHDVKLYTMKQFEGKILRLKVEENSCVNLPSSWEKQVASVDPTGCIILYADQDCRGFRKRLDKWSFGSSNLKDIAFESKLSSISTCPNVRKAIVIDEL